MAEGAASSDDSTKGDSDADAHWCATVKSLGFWRGSEKLDAPVYTKMRATEARLSTGFAARAVEWAARHHRSLKALRDS
jgi:hypothetical protein